MKGRAGALLTLTSPFTPMLFMGQEFAQEAEWSHERSLDWHLLENPESTPDDLMQFVKGPDFPTGGSILGRAGIMDAYRTGRGSIKMRATAAIEEGKRGQMQIVVTELPYQTSCSAIAGRIQELVDAGDLEGIADVNDGSAGGKTSLVVHLKRDANANVVLNNLFKLTQLQDSFGMNMVALVDGQPRVLNLKDLLEAFVGSTRAAVVVGVAAYYLRRERATAEARKMLAPGVTSPEIDRIVRESEFIDQRLFREYYEHLARGYARGVRVAQMAHEVDARYDPEVIAFAYTGIGNFVGMRWADWTAGGRVPDDVLDDVLELLGRGLAPGDSG